MVGRSGLFFSLDFFSLFYVPRFGKKIINEFANYLVSFVVYDPSLDQRILRKEQENNLKLKIKLTGWFIYDKIQRQSTDFPYITLDTEQTEHIWHSCE